MHTSGKQNSELWIIRSDGKQQRRLYRAESDHGFVHPVPVCWSTDGRRIVYWTVVCPGGSINDDGCPLWEIPIQGGKPQRLGIVLRSAGFVSPEPGGKYLAVAEGSNRDAGWNKRILLYNLGNGTCRRIAPPKQALICPAWSPNGKHIAFTSVTDIIGPPGEHQRRARLWIMNPDGSGRRPVTLVGADGALDDESPQWLSDSRHLVFQRDYGKTLWMTDLEGRQLIQLATLYEGTDDGSDEDQLDIWEPRPAKVMPRSALPPSAR
jgi:Tol biopolymer transport system component